MHRLCRVHPCMPAARSTAATDQPERLAISSRLGGRGSKVAPVPMKPTPAAVPWATRAIPLFEPPMATVATTSVAERAQCHEHVRFEAGDLCFVVARTRARHRAGPREEGESQGRARRSDESRLQRKNGTSRVIRKPCWNARELPQRAERRVTSPEAMLVPARPRRTPPRRS